MTKLDQLGRPMMRRAAGLKPNQARRQRGEKSPKLLRFIVLATTTRPDVSTQWTWKTSFARSRPTLVTDDKLLIDFCMDGAPSDDCFNDNHLGTPVTRLIPVRAPSTPSP
jgi:hypothetical protein